MHQILVSYNSRYSGGEIIHVADSEHVWGKRETLPAWIASGGKKSDFVIAYVLIVVSGLSASDVDLLNERVIEPNPDNPDDMIDKGRKYLLDNNTLWSGYENDVSNFGQIVMTRAKLLPHVKQRVF